MKKYIIGFSRRKNILSKLIMAFTGSNISHSFLRVDYDTGHSYILESTAGGTDVKWYDDWKNKGHSVVALYEILDGEEKGANIAWERISDEHIGKPYGWLQLIGDAYVIIVEKITGKKKRNPFGFSWSEVCSELVLAFISEINLSGFDDLDPETVTASDLWSIIRSDKKQFIDITQA